ncbi:hypothetical protein F7725_009632 [Dissostichus mawsoni]|uniref:PiggyBac transposable element-derived protein domain-containing protein n=1 Tax=Dissostichus mawsoni TaxID=36200 RepID=A0A7J5XLA8_DISMA|nr:hypothetical protein F7725_009632 [Dissostichus mawsoni]
MLEEILDCTIAEARRDNGDRATWDVSIMELKAFIALLYVRGAYCGKNIEVESFWSEQWGNAFFNATLSRNRFRDIMRYLRFDKKETRRRARNNMRWTYFNKEFSTQFELQPNGRREDEEDDEAGRRGEVGSRKTETMRGEKGHEDRGDEDRGEEDRAERRLLEELTRSPQNDEMVQNFFYHLMDIAVENSFLLYKELYKRRGDPARAKPLTQKSFREQLAKEMVEFSGVPAAAPPRPPTPPPSLTCVPVYYGEDATMVRRYCRKCSDAGNRRVPLRSISAENESLICTRASIDRPRVTNEQYNPEAVEEERLPLDLSSLKTSITDRSSTEVTNEQYNPEAVEEERLPLELTSLKTSTTDRSSTELFTVRGYSLVDYPDTDEEDEDFIQNCDEGNPKLRITEDVLMVRVLDFSSDEGSECPSTSKSERAPLRQRRACCRPIQTDLAGSDVSTADSEEEYVPNPREGESTDSEGSIEIPIIKKSNGVIQDTEESEGEASMSSLPGKFLTKHQKSAKKSDMKNRDSFISCWLFRVIKHERNNVLLPLTKAVAPELESVPRRKRLTAHSPVIFFASCMAESTCFVMFSNNKARHDELQAQNHKDRVTLERREKRRREKGGEEEMD